MSDLLPTVDEYGSRQFLKDGEERLPSADARNIWRYVQQRQITSLADVLILSKLYQQHPSIAKRLEVRYARHMQPREFKSGNFIITGSPRSNPWTALFDSSFNFQFDLECGGLRNTAPRPGEPAEYRGDAVRKIDVARVAVLRNLEGADFVLAIAGLGMEGTEGAGEFLLRDDSLPLIQKTLGLRAGERIPPFEMALEIRTMLGTARSARILAFRRH